MEMHQVRYFLAAARTLNFTRAAEECNVAQPSLTRAIKLLEHELGGDLFRREQKLSRLTELGERMLPLLRQCYEAEQGVKRLAQQIRRGDVCSMRLALSDTIDLGMILPILSEVRRTYPGLELTLLRGTGQDVAEFLKSGAADLGIAGALGSTWERLDAWPLFVEEFALLAGHTHVLAQSDVVEAESLGPHCLITRPYCESWEEVASALEQRGVCASQKHAVRCDQDMLVFLRAGFGVAIAPPMPSVPAGIHCASLKGLPVSRTIQLYSVAGRPRGAAVAATMKLLRAADWSLYLSARARSVRDDGPQPMHARRDAQAPARPHCAPLPAGGLAPVMAPGAIVEAPRAGD